MNFVGLFASTLVVAASLVSTSHAVLRPEKVFVAEGKKNRHYIKDGLITGGDRTIDDVSIRDIRRAMNTGFERWVIDLDAKKKTGEVAIPRPPYYQVAVNPDERRLVFTFFGNPKLDFNTKRVMKALKRSPLVSNVELYPKFEDNAWTFSVSLKKTQPVEIFELSNPVRIIVDLQR